MKAIIPKEFGQMRKEREVLGEAGLWSYRGWLEGMLMVGGGGGGEGMGSVGRARRMSALQGSGQVLPQLRLSPLLAQCHGRTQSIHNVLGLACKYTINSKRQKLDTLL